MRLPPLFSSLLVLSCVSAIVHAQEKEAPQYSLKQDEPRTGSNLKRTTLKGGPVPFNLRYSELTAEQQGFVKSEYEHLGPSDEPPYPVDGMTLIYKSMVKAQKAFNPIEDISAAVDIDSLGDAKSVVFFGKPDPNMKQFVASLLMLQKYKPAVCGGVPCNMQFPFRMRFETRWER